MLSCGILLLRVSKVCQAEAWASASPIRQHMPLPNGKGRQRICITQESASLMLMADAEGTTTTCAVIAHSAVQRQAGTDVSLAHAHEI